MGLVVAIGAAMFALGSVSAADEDMTTEEVYEDECASCHGMDGKGKTKSGKKFKVRDLTDPEVQASFTDAEATKAIREGIKNKDTGKWVMKPKDEDDLTDDQVKALVKWCRAYKGKK